MKPQLKKETLQDLELSVNYTLNEIFKKSNTKEDLEKNLSKLKIDFWYNDDEPNIIYLSYHFLDITKINLKLCLSDILDKIN